MLAVALSPKEPHPARGNTIAATVIDANRVRPNAISPTGYLTTCHFTTALPAANIMVEPTMYAMPSGT